MGFLKVTLKLLKRKNTWHANIKTMKYKIKIIHILLSPSLCFYDIIYNHIKLLAFFKK